MEDAEFQSAMRWNGPPLVLQQLSASGWLRNTLWLDEVDSTNRFARQLALRSGLDTPAIVVAKTQTAGRGRRGRSWHSDAGTLTFSVLLHKSNLGLGTDAWSRLALVAGLAVCDTLSEIVEPIPVSLKWPNDVYVNEAKVAGVLIETAGTNNDFVVVGIGVNIATDLSRAEPEIQSKATSILDTDGSKVGTFSILPRLIERLQMRIHQWATDSDGITRDFALVCLLTGRDVKANLGNAKIDGRCLGIGSEGELLVETADEVVSLRTGEVIFWGNRQQSDDY